MPQRPRAHQLEDISKRAFMSLVPAGWVVEERQRDYGVDLEVELFDAGGSATGLRFAVQLKGTDEPSLSQALVVRMRAATIRYLTQLDIPALLARYHSPTGAFYYRWLHALPVDLEDSSETVSIRLLEADMWSEVTPEEIKATVVRLRVWKSRDPDLPIEVLVRSELPPADLSSSTLALQLRSLLRNASDVVTFTAVARPDQVAHAAVGHDHLTAEVMGSSRSQWRPGNRGLTEVERANCILVQIALALDQSGKAGTAARFLRKTSLPVPILGEPAVAVSVGWILASSGQLDSALGLARDVMSEDGTAGFLTSREIARGIFNATAPRLQADRVAAEQIRDLQVDTIAYGHAHQVDPQLLSRAYYSLGNSHFNLQDYRGALHSFRLARFLDERYRTRDYWWGETAATLFELGRYRLAYEFYECGRSVSADPTPFLARAGDILLRMGRYQEAADRFGEYLQQSDGSNLWWDLRAFTIHNALSAIQPPDQPPQPAEAAQMLAQIDVSQAPDVVMTATVEVLHKDFLSHEAWHRLAESASLLGEVSDLSAGASMCLMTDPSCLDSYLLMLDSAARDNSLLDLAVSAMTVGYQLHGDAFLSQLAQEVQTTQVDASSYFMDALEEIAAVTPPYMPSISRHW